LPTIHVDDIDTHYQVSGSGEPLLLIHGLGSSTRDWEYNLPALVKHFKVVAYDVRGHGLTSRPRGPYSISLFARDAAGLLDKLGIGPAHVVGVSMGGMIALQLALDEPRLVKSLTMTNSGPRLDLDGLRDKLMLWTRLFLVRIMGMGMVGRKLAGEMFPDPGQEEMRDKVIERWAENDKTCYIESIKAIQGCNLTERLREIRCPVLEIRGDCDETSLSVSDEQLAAIPDARRFVINGSRHATPVDSAEEFNRRLIEFLSARSGEGA